MKIVLFHHIFLALTLVFGYLPTSRLYSQEKILRVLAKKVKKEKFFENLKINDSDPLIKNRRLSILVLLREKLLDIGDLSKLEGS